MCLLLTSSLVPPGRPALMQPGVLPGQCWAFSGAQGFVVIKVRARGVRLAVCSHDPLPCSTLFPSFL